MMAWVKVDDQFFRHPKVMAAGRDARDLYLVGLCYCAQGLTDGFIPGAALRVLAAEAEIDTGQSSAERLLSVGLWEEAAGGYTVHDYHEYQPTKERVLETREARAEAGRRGGKQKASNLLDKTLAKSKQNSSQPLPRTHPVPLNTTDLVGEGVQGEESGADAPTPPNVRQIRAERETRIPQDFPITQEMRDWARENVPRLDLEYAHKEFCTYWRSVKTKRLDWQQTWQNGMLKAHARAPTGQNYRKTAADFNSAKESLRTGRPAL